MIFLPGKLSAVEFSCLHPRREEAGKTASLVHPLEIERRAGPSRCPWHRITSPADAGP